MFVMSLLSLPLVSCECSAEAAVQHGDTYDMVLELLGQPEGYMVMEDTTWLNFDRGMVKLINNRVVEASLISPEEARLRKAQEQAERDRIQRIWAEQNARRLAEGRALKQAKLNDPVFLASPASFQVSYWREFQRYYPEIPVNEEYSIALARNESEQQQMLRFREQEQRIRELENRVQVAESRAERARAQNYHSSVVYVPVASRPWVTPAPSAHCAPQKVVPRHHGQLTSPSRLAYHSWHPGLSVAARWSF